MKRRGMHSGLRARPIAALAKGLLRRRSMRAHRAADAGRPAPVRFPRYQMLRALERLHAGELLVIAGESSDAIVIGRHPAVFVFQPLLDHAWVEPVRHERGLENVRYYALTRQGLRALEHGRDWYRGLPGWKRIAIRLYE